MKNSCCLIVLLIFTVSWSKSPRSEVNVLIDEMRTEIIKVAKIYNEQILLAESEL